MRVLLLGGTSFFGRDIARLLTEGGHSVTLFTRGNQSPAELKGLPRIVGDRRQAADLVRAAKAGPWDAVIDNIGYTGDEVAMALASFGEVGRYVFCSTVSVYRFAPGASHPIHENTVDFDCRPPEENSQDRHWLYARGKLEAERTLIRQTKTRWTILRPPVVYGPHDVTDRGFWYLARALDGGPVLLANDGTHSFRLAYSLDVARAFVEATVRPSALGKIYNVAQGEVITLREFVEAGASALGATPELCGIPLDYLGELAGPYANMVNFIPDFSAAEKDLGFAPTPWREFAAKTALWFRDEWRGDKTKLLASRREELELHRKWREATQSMKKRKWD